MKVITNPADFWYGRINKHPEDASRDEIFRIMWSFAKQYITRPTVSEEEINELIQPHAITLEHGEKAARDVFELLNR